MIGGTTARWATFASEITYDRLPIEAIEGAKCLLLDTIGTALAGSTLGDCASSVARLAQEHAAAGEATVLGTGLRTDALMAAFANGAFAHSLNYDAMGPNGGHIGVSAVPSPLVVSERRGGVTGKDLIVAIAVSAEFTTRLASSLHKAGVDPNEKFLEGQILGYFGATIGSGRALGFNPGQIHNALGIALMQTAGTRQVSVEGGAAKSIYGGYSNHAAVMSTLLAELEVDAKCAAIEGAAGLFGLFYNGRYDSSTLVEGLGDSFLSSNVQYKPWPTSLRLFPFIESGLALRTEHGVEPSDIAAIHVEASKTNTGWLEPRDERRHPHNAATAANSIYFGLSKALCNGTVTLADVTPEGLRQPEVLALADRTNYTLVDGFTTTDAAVRIVTTQGKNLTHRSVARKQALTFSQLVLKFNDCVQYASQALPNATRDELVERIATLETLTDARNLTALLRKAPDE